MRIEYKYRNRGGCLGWLIAAIIVIAIGCMSCGKTQLLPPATENRYTMIVDRYSLDTSIRYDKERYVQDLGALTIQEGYKLDTAKDMWYIDCNLLDRLQQLYYLKNGSKIQQSKFPNGKNNS